MRIDLIELEDFLFIRADLSGREVHNLGCNELTVGEHASGGRCSFVSGPTGPIIATSENGFSDIVEALSVLGCSDDLSAVPLARPLERRRPMH